jgi:hypothetical protein
MIDFSIRTQKNMPNENQVVLNNSIEENQQRLERLRNKRNWIY